MQIQAYDKPGNLATWAADINAAHADAVKHATSAIEYAKQAGELLLKVKQKLPHGAFGGWLEANVTVSARQAQRYMAAAQGKALSMRKVKEALPAPAKNDTVSLFKIRPGEAATLELDRDGWVDRLDIIPSTHSGFFHYLFTSGKEGDGCSATFSKRPIPTRFVASMVAKEMPEWEFANITRTKHEGREYNVVGTAPDGTEWVVNPPWVAAASSTPMATLAKRFAT